MSVAQISEKVRTYSCPLVEITGGEPLIQPGTPDLIAALLDQGYGVLLETNGSCDISLSDPRCTRIVDFKCPSSGESAANDYANIDRLQDHDEVKFVMANREDYEFAGEILRKVQAAFYGRGIPVHFSPVFGLLAPKTLVEWILRDRLQVRLNLQLHKVIWGPDERGV
jgi:7-carboxy-7-deazaguanine synthase